ncbi:MAG: hypothetical protein EHM42_05400, partial [Planctomycetaceae bacterium]
MMPPFNRRDFLRLLSGVGLAAASGGVLRPAAADEVDTPEDTAVQGGFRAGDRVPNFYVRAITGPLHSKSVCYVCRNGDRPVAMVLVRRIVPELESLLQGLDCVVDSHRAEGLRSFAVFVSRDSRRLLPQVQTLAFNGKIGLPLTIAAAPAEGPGLRGLPEDIAVSVVLYREQTVRSALAFRDEELSPEAVERVVKATRELAELERP